MGIAVSVENGLQRQAGYWTIIPPTTSLLETNRPQAQIHALHGQTRDINLSIPIKIQAWMPIMCKRYNDLQSIKSLHGIHHAIVSPFKIIVLCLVIWNESQLSVSHFHPHRSEERRVGK